MILEVLESWQNISLTAYYIQAISFKIHYFKVGNTWEILPVIADSWGKISSKKLSYHAQHESRIMYCSCLGINICDCCSTIKIPGILRILSEHCFLLPIFSPFGFSRATHFSGPYIGCRGCSDIRSYVLWGWEKIISELYMRIEEESLVSRLKTNPDEYSRMATNTHLAQSNTTLALSG